MKELCIYVCATLAMFLLLVGRSDVAGSKCADLEVWLEMPRSEYVLCEDIWVFLFVANREGDSVTIPYVNRKQQGRLDFRIVNDSGQESRYSGLIDAEQSEEVVLPPADTIVFPLNIRAGYSVYRERSELLPHIPTGEYRVSAVYRDTYRTNTLPFTVRELTTSERGVVMEVVSTSSEFRHGADRVNDLIELFQQYNDTPFGSLIGRQAVLLAASNDAPDSLKLHCSKMLVNSHPSAGSSEVAFIWLLQTLNEEQFTSFVNSNRQMLADKYTRFMLRQVLLTQGRADLCAQLLKK